MSLRFGPRDMWALMWLSEMRGAPMNVVADLLGSSEYNAYRVVRRWRAGYFTALEAAQIVHGEQRFCSGSVESHTGKRNHVQALSASRHMSDVQNLVRPGKLH